MKQIIKYQSLYDHYESDACVVWCFDARFSPLLEKFIAEKELKNIDLVKIAGGARVFATPEMEAEEEYFRGQIEKSVKLHHTRKAILMVHQNCGAYGKTFDDVAAEEVFYKNELQGAKKSVEEFLASKNLQIPIETYYATFDGLYQV